MSVPSGFLNLDKPEGVTSHGAVQKLRKILGLKKIGHGGTLDPAATGVLPILLGDATRLMEFMAKAEKEYRATIHLGVTTDTQDGEGKVIQRRDLPADLAESKIEAEVRKFVGEIDQTVPAYSAVKKEGKRLYELARKGEEVERPVRKVRIHAIEVVNFRSPELVLDIKCGKGTYIRQIAADLGDRLECGAHLSALRRTRVGPLRVDDAVDLDSVTVETRILPMRTIGFAMPVAEVDLATARKIGHGQTVPLDLLGVSPGPDNLVAVCLSEADLVSVVRIESGKARPLKVFPAQIG